METCNICAETYNKRTRAKLNCQYCEFTACTKCCQTYILSETAPKCMNTQCNREWTRNFMKEQFTQSFMNKDWKKHREQVIYDQQRALLPATQPIVEQRIHRDRIGEEIRQVQRQMRDMRIQLYQLYGQYTQREEVAAERRQCTRACPDNDCRGFLSSQWKCGLCEKWSCPRCHEVKGHDRDAPHECNPDNVASAELMNQDTKPCPTCGMGIFKIDGCSQMFCTMCNTAFCWRTGRIETNIHNPHYFEWLRQQGNRQEERNPLDVLCGRELDQRFVRHLNRSLSAHVNHEQNKGRKLMNIVRCMVHVRLVELPRYLVDHVQNHQELRIKYMRNQITEEYFKQMLQRDDKKYQKKREYAQILQMVVNTCTDILHRFLEEVRKRDWNGEFGVLDEIDRMRCYANECLQEVSATYGSVRMYFTKYMDFTPYSPRYENDADDNDNTIHT